MSQNSAKLKCMAELLRVVCYMPMTIHFITGNFNLSITPFIFILCFTLFTCSYKFFLSLITNFFLILDIPISLKACLVFAICNKYPPLNHYCSQLLFCFSVPHKSKILEWVTSSCLRLLISYIFNSSAMLSSHIPTEKHFVIITDSIVFKYNRSVFGLVSLNFSVAQSVVVFSLASVTA